MMVGLLENQREGMTRFLAAGRLPETATEQAAGSLVIKAVVKSMLATG
jgi:hypothetical protein